VVYATTAKTLASAAAVGGIDEAGRGSILGPMVVAGVSAEPKALAELREMGVKDSKAVRPEKRRALYDEIVQRSLCVHWVAVHPREIDKYVTYGRKYRRLNYLEAMHMAAVIGMLGAGLVFVDAPDTNPRRFSRELSEMLDPCPKIVAEHRADVTYVVVGAASIIAKVERDRAVERLREENGDFGSGYPSDRRTINYLKEYVRKEGSQPPFARSSWKTWRRILVTTLDL
jgi:ribonuclease HII